MSWSDRHNHFVALGHTALELENVSHVVGYLISLIMSLVVHDSSEVSSIREVLAFICGEVDQLAAVIHVHGFNTTLNLLHKVWCKRVISMFTIHLDHSECTKVLTCDIKHLALHHTLISSVDIKPVSSGYLSPQKLRALEILCFLVFQTIEHVLIKYILINLMYNINE